MQNKLMRTGLMGLMLLLSCGAWAAKSDAHKAIIEARTMIDAAERSDADHHAPAELKMARDHLNTAQQQFDEREWTEAEISAKKSQRDAELADAKAHAISAEMALAQMQQVIDTLKQELARRGEEL